MIITFDHYIKFAESEQWAFHYFAMGHLQKCVGAFISCLWASWLATMEVEYFTR